MLYFNRDYSEFTVNNFTNNNGLLAAQIIDNETGKTLTVNNMEAIGFKDGTILGNSSDERLEANYIADALDEDDSSSSNKIEGSTADLDQGPEDGIMQVTLSVSNGLITLGQDNGIEFVSGDGEDDASITMKGTLSDLNAAIGSLTYTPNNGFVGTDTLNISVTDRGNVGVDPSNDAITGVEGLTDTGTDSDEIAIGSLDIVVKYDNVAPEANGVSATTPEDTAVTLAGLTATDIDGTIASFTLDTLPANGTLTLPGGGAAQIGVAYTAAQVNGLVFTPSANWNGQTSFTYHATDNEGLDSAAATGTITVTPVNDAPEANGVSAKGLEDHVLQLPTLEATDIDSEIAGFKITSLPDAALGVLKLQNGQAVTEGQVLTKTQVEGLQFVPVANKHGETSFKFIAHDAEGLESNEVAMSIDVAPQGDAPTTSTTPISGTILQTSNFTFSLSGSDIDGGTGKDDGVITSYVITNLPGGSVGILKLSTGQSLQQGQEITVAQAQNLLFDPNNSFSGDVVINFVAKDSDGLTSNTGAVNIKVNAVPAAPPLPKPESPPQETPQPKNEPKGEPKTEGNKTSSGFFGQPDQGNEPFNSVLNDYDSSVPESDSSLKLVIDVPDQVFSADKPQEFAIPEGSFKHTDPNAELTFEAARPDGTPLPSWITFNKQTMTFLVKPPEGEGSTQDIMVKARDKDGNEATATFKVVMMKGVGTSVQQTSENGDGDAQGNDADDSENSLPEQEFDFDIFNIETSAGGEDEGNEGQDQDEEGNDAEENKSDDDDQDQEDGERHGALDDDAFEQYEQKESFSSQIARMQDATLANENDALIDAATEMNKKS